MFKIINLSIRFILELIILFSLADWGFHFDHGVALKLVLGIGVPLLIAIIWGKIISPKATIKLSLTWTLFIELIIFSLAALCLIDLGFKKFAVIFILIEVVNRFLIIRWRLQ